MSVEIITIGSELLHGLVRDTNGARIVELLASAGVEVLYRTTVGDEGRRMAEVFRAASHRARHVITTGGLGSTPDDVTRKTIATVFRRRLVLDETVLDRMRARFRERGMEMPAINESQALIPRGARIIENPRGSAPGLHFVHQETDFYCLPGVPSEAEGMVEHYVLPSIQAQLGQAQIARRVVRTAGISESALVERFQALETAETKVRIGYLPHASGVDVALTTASPDPAWTAEALDGVERRVRELAGDHVYGGGRETLSAALGALLVERKLRIATAESFTGGGLGGAITQTPGASRYYLGGIVAYSNRAKEEALGVKASTLERHGAVSAEVAEEMASGARERFDSDLALSSTGIAGPDGGSAEKPVGLVYLALAFRQGARSVRIVSTGTREEIIARSIASAMDLARRHLVLAPV